MELSQVLLQGSHRTLSGMYSRGHMDLKCVLQGSYEALSGMSDVHHWSCGALGYNGSFTLADPDSDPYSDSDSCTIQILRERDPDMNQCEKF